MRRIGALGASVDVEGFALAGALVFPADDDNVIDAMWDALDDDIDVLILTSIAAERLRLRFDERPLLLTVVMPR